MARGKVPIVVGGTHYYVESLLWDGFIGQNWTAEKEHQDIAGDQDTSNSIESNNFEQIQVKKKNF